MDNPGQDRLVGIDIGGTAMKLAVVSGQRPPLMLSSPGYDRPGLDEMAGVLHDLWESARLSAAGALRVNVCVPGPLDGDGLLEAAANLPALVNVRVGAWVQEVLGLAERPCVLTDALAAALGDYHIDPRRGRTLYLSIGAGVGGVVLDGGKPLLVTRGTSGHFGHMDVSGGEADAPASSAGGRGALEAYVGAGALARAGVDLDRPDAMLHPYMTRAIGALSRGIRILLAIYRPDHIVLLGGVGLRLRPMLAELNQLVRQDLTSAAPPEFTVECGRAGYYAAALGAARHT